MTLLRQIKDLRQEYAAIHSHVLRQVIEVHGGIPLILDPKKSLRRTLLPGFLVIGGLPLAQPYEPDAGAGIPGVVRRDEEQDESEQESADIIA